MRLDQVMRIYSECRLAQCHNPEHFYPNSFDVQMQDGRLVVVAVPKRRVKKNFRIVGVLKPYGRV